MTEATILANARLVLPDEVLRGQLVLRGGQIAEIGTGIAVPAGAMDCDGDYLAPGLIELHTDNLERHLSPRQKANWPHRAALAAHDAELAGTGITTVFDALRVGSILNGPGDRYRRYARAVANEILKMKTAGMFRISHILHLRAEICSETLIEELDSFLPDDHVGILSLMDHVPGQRQFRDLGKYQAYMIGKYGMTEATFAAHVTRLYDIHRDIGARNQAKAVAAAHQLGAVLASHDDTTADHVAISRRHGVTLAEFPTTEDAAEACHADDIAVIMGAPNLVRGGSHSGNVAAETLARADRLDILSSDYAPASLLLGAAQLGQLWNDMARGITTVTSTPARRAGLSDRGTIAIGRRADLVRFRLHGDLPLPAGVWSGGRRVA